MATEAKSEETITAMDFKKCVMVEPRNELERTAQAIALCMPCQLCPDPCKAKENSSMANCVHQWMKIMVNAVNH